MATEKINIKQLAAESRSLPLWRRNMYLTMVGGAILVATLLVLVAMGLYRNSDAVRLDLSRPGYQEVRSQVSRDHSVSSFSPTGPLNQSAIEEFKRKYDESLSASDSSTAFQPEALSDSALLLPQVAP